jgi:predicted component of type VI protein secretion system
LATFASETKWPRMHSRYQQSNQGLSFHKLMNEIRQVLGTRSLTTHNATPLGVT